MNKIHSKKEKIWTKDKTKFLIKWWPHFGSSATAKQLNLKTSQIKGKVNKLKLVLLTKNKRLCFDCRKKFQHSRSYGLRCVECHLLNRKKTKATKIQTLSQWIGSATNTARHRSIEPSNLTTKYMVDLWNKQNGKCYYSGMEMLVHKYGTGRSYYSPSIDRIDCKRGYIQGNVVWCCWICNLGKSTLSYDEYIKICENVSNNDLLRRIENGIT